jgi:phosphoadenosine phosphosulfate reductase
MKALQFSGGLDSLATLFLKREDWDDILVMWCNTGAAYPETAAYMADIADVVPHFLEVKSDKPAWEAVNGVAVDLVATDSTILGQAIRGTLDSPRFIDYLQCCSANIWHPLAEAVFQRGIKHVIRGQRQGEKRKAPIRSGHVDHNGVLYEFPIEAWTKEQVWAYCREHCRDWIPPYYAAGEQTSHDCWDCVAYLDENRSRLQNLPDEKKVVVAQKLQNHYKSIVKQLEVMEATDVDVH